MTLIVGLVATAALATGGAFVADEVNENNRAQQPCRNLTSFVVQHGEISNNPRGIPGVAIIGDSYTAGDVLVDRTDAWSYSIGGTLAGIGSTGFVSGGYCGDSAFTARIDAVVATKPDVLLIQGGLNDTGSSVDDIAQAVKILLEASCTVPSVFIIGPVDALAREGVPAVDSALSEAATRAGVKYISAIGWQVEFGHDNLHLTPAGHIDFAARVRAETGIGQPL